VKQRCLKTGCLSRLLAVTACVVVALTVAPLAWVSDVYAFEPNASGGASSGAQQSEGILPIPDYSGDLCTRPALTGDWGGLRQQWAEKGVTFRFDWYQAVQGIVKGGTDNRWAYGTNLDLYANLDLDRMGVIPGGLVAFRAQSRFGDSVNTNTGLLLPVNTYSYFPFTDPPDENVPIAITELNYTQFLSEEFGLLVGKITTMKNTNEFAGGEGRTQFMNFQFLFPAVYAQLVPYSTLAAGALWMPSGRFQFTSILMNTADSSTTTGFGDIGEGATWWNSLDIQYEMNGLPGGSTLGFLYAFNGDFTRIGGMSYDPDVGIFIGKETESWALRWDGWQYLFTETEPGTVVDPRDGWQDLQGIGVFASLGLGDKNTNPVSFAASVGVAGRGVFPGRDDDTLGLGYFYNDLQEPRPILANFLQSSTQGIEFYYNAAILRWLSLTGDVQWTKSARAKVDDSLVLGFRCNVSF
jgi:porin